MLLRVNDRVTCAWCILGLGAYNAVMVTLLALYLLGQKIDCGPV